MANAIIGALRVSLGIDSAQFTAGLKDAQGRLKAFGTRMQGIGAGITEVGKKMSIASAAVAGVGLAMGGLVKRTADAGEAIRRQSQIANAGVVEFQRFAAGARTVGIEQDKLADILKDVNDRVGDFLSTGGGPMADFFENVAPKVGVTADQFARLSGPEALQLYVDTLEQAGLSQQEMTFYLEAMASDATALIPLLQNGGAEMKRFGDAAEAAGSVLSADAIASSVAFNAELRKLMDSLGGLVNRIGVALMPVMTALAAAFNEKVVPALGIVVGWIEQAAMWFGQLSPQVQETAAIIAAALGVGGPVLMAIGAMTQAIGAMIAASGPIGLLIAAAGLAVAAWVAWGDEIKAVIASVVDAVGTVVDRLTQGAQTAIQAHVQMSLAIRDAAQQAYDWAVQKFNELLEFFASLPGKMVEIGANIVQGLIDGLSAKWEALKAQVYEMANALPDWMKDVLDIRSPSRVFRAIGQFITEGLGLGISDNVPMVGQAMQGVADTVAAEGQKTIGIAQKIADGLKGTLSGWIVNGGSLSDGLRSMGQSLLGGLASNFANSALDDLFGLMGFAKGGVFSGGRVQAFAKGGIVSGATTFPMRGGMGLMGEAGPEAIMPLARGPGGKLGVEAVGGGTVRIIIEEAPGFASRVQTVASGVAVEVVNEYDRKVLPATLDRYTRDPSMR